MLRGLLLALPLIGVSASALAPSQPITALAPLEVWADGFRTLRGIAIDADGHVYVADREAGTVTRVDGGHRRVLARHLDRPVGLALDSLGRLLVAEERRGRVVRLDPSGPTPLVKGIKQPRWLALSENGTLYVSARRLTRGTDPEPDDESVEPEVIVALAPDGSLSVFADGFERLQGLAARHGAVYAATTGRRGTRGDDGVVYRIPIRADGRAGRIARLGPRADFERPAGVAIDRLGALYVSAPEADLDGRRSRHAVVKLHAAGAATLFAHDLDDPQGLAFDTHGHLYVADGRAGRVLRFLAPAPPTLVHVPRFTRHAPITLTGTTVPHARVDVFVDGAASPVTVAAGATGAFSASIAPAANVETGIDVLATAHRGKGLTSPASEISVVLDTLAPALVVQAPAAGAFVRGTVEIEVGAADAGSRVATLGVSAGGRALATVVTPPLPASAASARASWPTPGVADGAHTLTATAADRAGNAVRVTRVVIVDNTAPETEITSGPDGVITQPAATFTFAGSDNLTPPSGLRFAWRLDGGPRGPFTTDTSVALTDLSPGSHVVEVVAQDLAGNEDPTPARRTFTVGALGVAVSITEPAAGAAVAVGSLLVRGTVDAGGADVGVGVNGIAALVHGTEWAVLIPIAPGDNVITAIAGTIAGAEGTASITVNGAEAESGLFLRAEPASGVAPLEVTWRVAGRTPRPLVTFELDQHGTGTFGAPVAVLDDTRSTYTDAGLWLPAVRATDDQGNVHVAKTLVRADSAQTAHDRFQALWASFKARLQAGDPAGALAHLSPSLRPRFEPIFQQLGAALPGVAAGFGPIELIDEVENLAEAALVQMEDGAPRLYFIYFRRDNRGRWLIQEM